MTEVAEERYSRQSFLGDEAQERVARCRVGVVGLGGGGSHIVQQLAHIGFLHYILYDPDVVKDVNLNRLIGATEADVAADRPKIAVAQRTIRGLQQDAHIEARQVRWQDDPLPLRHCDLIFGCVDGLAERRDLEACARRYLIPYLDIGLDVHQVEPEPPVMGGQVVLSMPGDLCLTCLGILTEGDLAGEAARYGAAGPRPQVVWANGALAATAVGIAIDLLTDWTRNTRGPVYLSYDGNRGTMKPHVRLEFVPAYCTHYAVDKVGDPLFRPL